jgi:lysyl-tRNA synthetase class 2
MKRTPVTSRAVVSVGYDASARELEIEFRGGRVYRYRDVPHDVHQFLLRTPEKGRYVNRVIADSFAYSDVSDNAVQQNVAAALEASLQRLRRDN